MDEQLKKQFDGLCQEFGMNATAAINKFARAVVRQHRIPFEIAVPEPTVTREDALQAFMSLREQARVNGVSEMTLEEINEEIRRARLGDADE